jgi:hypothetical protein
MNIRACNLLFAVLFITAIIPGVAWAAIGAVELATPIVSTADPDAVATPSRGNGLMRRAQFWTPRACGTAGAPCGGTTGAVCCFGLYCSYHEGRMYGRCVPY